LEHPEQARATRRDQVASLRVTGLAAGYPSREVLQGIDLVVRSGDVCVLLGPNGAGKSTLVRALAGLLSPRAGAIELLGRPLASLDRREVARRVAVVHQSTEVAMGFTVRQVVEMGRAPHQGTWMRASAPDRVIVKEALAACRLEEIADRPVETLSGGEQKRVMMGRALAQRAEVLLLDEPGAHLDVRATIELFEVVRREVTERGLACVAVLHDLNLAAHHADHVLLLKDGRAVAAGSPADVMTAETLGRAFDAALSCGVDPASGRTYYLPLRARAPSPGR
jgi:iron complex transport system ATP-binding protein